MKILLGVSFKKIEPRGSILVEFIFMQITFIERCLSQNIENAAFFA